MLQEFLKWFPATSSADVRHDWWDPAAKKIVIKGQVQQGGIFANKQSRKLLLCPVDHHLFVL